MQETADARKQKRSAQRHFEKECAASPSDEQLASFVKAIADRAVAYFEVHTEYVEVDIDLDFPEAHPLTSWYTSMYAASFHTCDVHQAREEMRKIVADLFESISDGQPTFIRTFEHMRCVSVSLKSFM